MSGGETAPTAEMANRISQEIFEWFRWKRVDLLDQNFTCVKATKHNGKEKAEHTHPVDVVFGYVDPYLNRRILMNMDLKSYSTSSISASPVRAALKSLAQTIDCARSSEEWDSRYNLEEGESEIRGALFVYNHDAEYDKHFYDIFNPKKSGRFEHGERGIRTENLPLEPNMMLHVIDPLMINYMTTIISDANRLHREGSFPETSYQFFYPELRRHRVLVRSDEAPATIELIAGPFLIISHDTVTKYDEKKKATVERHGPGYVIYYNRPGNSHAEFMYLFDCLATYQIPQAGQSLRIRVAHHQPHKDIRSHFQRAIDAYLHDWGFDAAKREMLEAIKLDILEIEKKTFSKVELGWEKKGK
ncbi:hypothetical protein BKK81_11740 [Cupriavidus sp. USMAHM13]|uniref:hypothetical protein n=1 Tax=Cupriavidus sp. USMAHM13 TaxID=1389192 RepID=UPI0008A6DD4F|nr:hypothetical protein [Cupriavidus sp. USMAHM13]AOY99837.1 hypothetical protein BKK81_11740 [Cupriavidus sp. USMAHM13]